MLEEEDDYALAVGGDDPEEHARLKELADLVHASVIGLSRRDAVAVALVTLGFSVADVAAALQVTHGNAKVLLHRARRRLRSALILQMLVKNKETGCSTFEELRRNGDLGVVGRHVERCDSCIDRAKSDV